MSIVVVDICLIVVFTDVSNNGYDSISKWITHIHTRCLILFLFIGFMCVCVCVMCCGSQVSAICLKKKFLHSATVGGGGGDSPHYFINQMDRNTHGIIPIPLHCIQINSVKRNQMENFLLLDKKWNYPTMIMATAKKKTNQWLWWLNELMNEWNDITRFLPNPGWNFYLFFCQP